jgi:hypothetical protein
MGSVGTPMATVTGHIIPKGLWIIGIVSFAE